MRIRFNDINGWLTMILILEWVYINILNYIIASWKKSPAQSNRNPLKLRKFKTIWHNLKHRLTPMSSHRPAESQSKWHSDCDPWTTPRPCAETLAYSKSWTSRTANYCKSTYCHKYLRSGQSFKNFRFNYVMEQKSTQSDVYNSLRIDVTISSFRIFWSRHLTVTPSPSSRTVKRVVARLTPWLALKTSSARKCSSLMRLMASFLEQ